MKLNWLSEYLANIINVSRIYDAIARPFAEVRLELLTPQAIYCRIKSTSAEALEHILIACAVYFLVCLGLYKLTFWLSVTGAPVARKKQQQQQRHNVNANDDKNGLRNTLQKSLRLRSVHLPKAALMGRVLLVIAHPDDECMFFGPLIYSLTQRDGCQVYVLCLSNGEQLTNIHIPYL